MVIMEVGVSVCVNQFLGVDRKTHYINEIVNAVDRRCFFYWIVTETGPLVLALQLNKVSLRLH